MTAKERYRRAHAKHFQQQHPIAYDDHGCPDPTYPKVNTDTGLKTFIKNFLTWEGHFANITNNKGWAREKTAPKFNLMTGKVQQVLTGQKQWNRSSSKNGMQDVDANLKHPSHKFGIPWKIEAKTKNDWVKDEQIEFGDTVLSTGAIWSVVHGPDDFLRQFDKIMMES